MTAIDAAESSGPQDIHAVFLLHGLWGKASDLLSLKKGIDKASKIRAGIPVEVVICKSYEHSKTYDGVDVCADRAIDEIHQYMVSWKPRRVTRFSILGYSLGGLIARLVVYKLHHEGFFKHVSPYNFTTFASPAIGLPQKKGVLPAITRAASKFFLSRSGQHLELADDFDGGKPLVYWLATEPYTQVIREFQHINIYANAVMDRVVPYLTGGISDSDPFLPALMKARQEGFRAVGNRVYIDKIKLTFDLKYPAVVSNVDEIRHNHVEEPDLESGLAHESQDATVTAPPYITSLQASSGWAMIRPWLTPRPYPFLPRPLGWLLVILIPFVIPAALFIIGTFTVQRIGSQFRIRQHFKRKHSLKSDVSLPTVSPYASRKAAEAVAAPEPTRDLPLPPPAIPVSENLTTHPENESWASTNLPIAGISPATTFTGSIVADLSGLYTPGKAQHLSEMQKDMVRQINEHLPTMRKHLAFFPDAFTSHPVILCKDEDDPQCRKGLSIVQHWADRFEF